MRKRWLHTILVVVVAATAAAPSSLGRDTQQAGYPITIVLLNSKENPMGHRSFIVNDNNGAFSYRFTGVTNASSRASILVPAGAVSLQAIVSYSSAGQLEYLTAPGYASFREPSQIRTATFRFAVAGSKPGATGTDWSQYYGGSIDVGTWYMPSGIPSTATVDFTLVPVGLLADGTRGSAILEFRSYGAIVSGGNGAGVQLNQTPFLYDIPLGTYRMTATISWPGQPTATLKVLNGGYQNDGGIIVFDNSVPGESALSRDAISP